MSLSGLSGAASWLASIKSLSVRVQLDDISRTICIIRQHYPDKIRQIVNLQDLYYQNKRAIISGWYINVKANILITSPEQRDEDSYCARLILQDASELLCDHQTGQHIQGWC